jgi:two-component system cell cycle response regulator DivK
MKPVILIVEDNPLSAELLCEWLTMEGYETVTADGLERALGVLRHNQPALVLLDIGLGSDDGLSLVSWIRAHSALRSIPVIAVSAHAMAADQQRMLNAGCRAFIAKPIDFEQLRKELRCLLPREAST